MNYYRLKLIIILILFYFLPVKAQTEKEDIKKQGWTTKLEVGLDVISNLLINPSVGGGESRLGFGATLGLHSLYNKGKFSWNTSLNGTYGIQKIGSGYLEGSPEDKVPFQKNIDNIWLNSKVNLQTSYFSKFFYTADFFFSSQMTQTFEDNFLEDIRDRGHPISKFLSPAVLQLALGIDFKPNDYFSVFLSPASYKATIVLDDEIANDIATDDSGNVLGTIHGNPFEQNANGENEFENFDNQIGASARIIYNNQITKSLLISSNLSAFSNYKRDPDHIDVNWRNEIELTIFKGLRLSLLSLLNYDHDIFVQITDNNAVGGINGLGRRVSYTQQLFFKYSHVFGAKENRTR